MYPPGWRTHLRVLPSEVVEPTLHHIQRHVITADRQHIHVLDEAAHVQEGENLLHVRGYHVELRWDGGGMHE